MFHELLKVFAQIMEAKSQIGLELCSKRIGTNSRKGIVDGHSLNIVYDR